MDIVNHEAAAAARTAEIAEEPVSADGVRLTPTNTITPMGYVKCSLCSNIIDDEATHIAEEHGHVQHIKAMLQVPLSSPAPFHVPAAGTATKNKVSQHDSSSGHSDGDAASLHAVGAFAVAMSQSADRGAAAFAVLERAPRQLNRLLDGIRNSHVHVYVLGSVVSMGCWDGVGDGDFAFIEPKWLYTPAPSRQVVLVKEDNVDGEGEEKEDGEEEEEREEEGPAAAPIIEDDDSEDSKNGVDGGEPAAAAHEPLPTFDEIIGALRSPDNGQGLSTLEKQIILSVTARLRGAGFHFEELDPVLQARIPVVRRKRPTRDMMNLRAMEQEHLIRVCFDHPSDEEKFRRGRLQALLSTYNAREVQQNIHAARWKQLVLAVPDGCDAVHLMSRRERNSGIRKQWVMRRRTPEIFAIDFDLSCRCHGIRNSWLLRRYLEQDEVYRMGNVFLKQWSKACGINNSRVGFLTSYAVLILWVYFLLRRGVVTFVNPNDVPVLPDPEQQMEVPYMPLWPRLDDPAADDARTTRLGALLRDFFFFYGEEFDWATQVVTIRQPCPTAADVRTKADLNWLTDDTVSLLLRNRCYHIFSIEDVYEDNLDLGRHLTKDKAAWTRLQFRLAYTRCGGTAAQLMRLLDVPQKRANDVLQARLFHYLLQSTKTAKATAGELVNCLCGADANFPGEDPQYLLSAYELGNRLSDLWYDEEQVGLDIANHKRYDRRANLFSPPKNPTEHGEWGLLCTDPLPADTGAPQKAQMATRWVCLEPPVASVNHRVLGGAIAQRAPNLQWAEQLAKERKQYTKMERLFALHSSGKASANAEEKASPAVVGLALPNLAKLAVYPHCFYTLQSHRFFSSYDARGTFLQCLEDVAWEVTELREEPDADTTAILANRQRLFAYLKDRLGSRAKALPNYEAVLHYVVISSCNYVQFHLQGKASQLVLSSVLLRILGADGSAADAPLNMKATAKKVGTYTEGGRNKDREVPVQPA